MVRPRKSRAVEFEPNVTYFKPRAVPLSELEEMEIGYEELEAMRLVNIEKLSQIEAAERMGVHQSTFQRTLSKAREKVTDALVNGKAIKIKGGTYKLDKSLQKRVNGTGICICIVCGHSQKHQRGFPCAKMKCLKCNSPMVRG